MITYTPIPIFLLLLRAVQPTSYESEYRMSIAVKKGIPANQHSMAIGAQSYLELIKNSTIFVDTTLFIESMVTGNCSQPRLILTPRKWGKTINLDMLKTFLEIQVDEEGRPLSPRESTSHYRLFKKGELVLDNGQVEHFEEPLLISENEYLLENYQGKVPIIFFTMKHGINAQFKNINASLMHAVKGAYERHKYIEKILPNLNLDQTDLTSVQKILQYDTSDRTPYQRGITLLCKILHAHYKRKPIVILDAYDSPLWSILQTGSTTTDAIVLDILSVMEEFIVGTFVTNEDIDHCIISGIQALGRYSNGTRWYYNLHDCTRKKQQVCEYFGFNEEAVGLLYDKYDISPPLREKARKWYDGFESKASTRRFYSPVSISHFLNTKKIANYWDSSPDRLLANKFLKYFFEMLIQFIGKEVKNVCSGACIGEYVARHIRDAFLPIEFFHYLFRMGYFGLSRANIPNPIEMFYTEIRLPNYEIAFEISDWMFANYKRLYRLSDHLVLEAATTLLQIVENKVDNTTCASLDRSLQLLYRNASTPFIIMTTTTNTIPFFPYVIKQNPFRAPFHSVLNCVTLKMQCLTEFETVVFYNRLREADVVIFNQRTRSATILELRTNVTSPEILLNHTLHFNVSLHDVGEVKVINYFAIIVLPDKTVQSVRKSIQVDSD